MSWFTEKKLVITGRQKVRPRVTVHTLSLLLRIAIASLIHLVLRSDSCPTTFTRSQSITWFSLVAWSLLIYYNVLFMDTNYTNVDRDWTPPCCQSVILLLYVLRSKCHFILCRYRSTYQNAGRKLELGTKLEKLSYQSQSMSSDSTVIFSRFSSDVLALHYIVSVQAYSTISRWHFLLLTPCTPAVTGWAHCCLCWAFTKVHSISVSVNTFL